MNFASTFEQITDTVTTYVPNLIAAVGILVIGWFVALVVSRIVQAALRKTNVDNRLVG